MDDEDNGLMRPGATNRVVGRTPDHELRTPGKATHTERLPSSSRSPRSPISPRAENPEPAEQAQASAQKHLEQARSKLRALEAANEARDQHGSWSAAKAVRRYLHAARLSADRFPDPAIAAAIGELEDASRLHLAAADRLAKSASAAPASRKLPSAVRGDLEQATGRSLDHVRVHDGADGAAVAEQHGARAVAIGRDIHMGAGQLDATTPEGRELIAHEVAHVVQADAHPGPEVAAAKQEGKGTESDAEREADGFGASFRANGGSATWSPAVAVSGATPMHKPETGQSAKISPEPAGKPPEQVVRVDQQASTKKDAAELVTADSYLSFWATELLDIVAKNAGPNPPHPHARLRWAIPGNAVVDQLQMWLQMERARFGSDDRAALVRLLYPVDVFRIVDTYRDLHPPAAGREGDGPLGPSSWQTAISDVIAAEARPRWSESIARAGQRYVAAADELHASGVHDEQEIKRRLAADNAVLSHSPLDHIVLLVFRDAQMIKYAAPTTKAPREYAHNELKPLLVTCMGASDPTLWNVVRADGATADQLAAVLFSQGGDATAHSYSADMITDAAPYFILPPAWAATVKTIAGQVGPAIYEPADAKKKREGAQYDPPAMQRAAGQEAPDPRMALVDSSLSEEIALAQNEIATKRERGGVHEKAEPTTFSSTAATLVGAGFDRLQYLREVLAPWGLAETLEPVRAFLAGARAKTMRSAVLNPSWSSLLGHQGELLRQISENVASFVTEVGSPARGGDTSTPVGNVLGLYARAAGSSHLVGVGTALLANAEKARRGVMLATVEFALRSSGAAIAEERGFEHQTHNVDPAALNLDDKQKELKLRGAQMRNALVQGSAVDAGAAETLILEAERNRLIATVASLKLQLHEFKVAADKGTLKFIPGLAENTEHLNMRLDAPFLEAQLAKIPEHLAIPEEKKYGKRSTKDANDPALPEEATLRRNTLRQYVQSAHAELGTLKQEYRIEEFLQRANQVLADQQWRTMIVSAAALIGLGLVTGGAASFVGGVVRGTMLADLGADAAALASTVRTARAAGTAAELITDAALTGAGQKALMGGDASFAENLVANALTRFALHPLGRFTAGLGEVDRRSLSAWERVGHGAKFVLAHGLQLSAEMITSTAIGYAVHRVTSMARGEKPTDEMVDSWLLQGVTFALGRYLNGRLQHQMDALSKLGQRAGRLPSRMRKLAERAAELERSGDSEQALDVLVEHRALAAEQVELLGQLEREGKLRGPEAEALRADASADDHVIESHAFVAVQARAAKLVPIVEAAGRWAGDPGDIAAMIRRAADLGVDVRVVEAGNAQKRWKVKVGDTVLEIDERRTATSRSSVEERAGAPGADDTDASGLASTSEQLAVETDASGRIAIAGDDAHLRAGAQRAQPEAGYVDVVVHADDNHFYIVRNGVEIAVTHRTVAKLLEKAGLKPPTKIRLLACEGGKSPWAVAQHLASKTGLEVKAPTKKVWVDEAGTVGVGRRGQHEGEWETFKPYDKNSGEPPPELESKRVLVVPEEGGRVEPRATDRDPVLQSKHDHRDRVEAWNHDQLQAQIGKPLVLDSTLGDGVRIKVQKTAAGYEVTAVRYGPDARANDVQRHADIVARVERYNGLVGKLRSWKDSLFGPRAKPDYARGSRGDRLHTELEKLEAHIRDTDIMRSNDAVDAARAKEEIEFLTDAVNEIREQLDDKHHDLHTQDAEFDIARVTEPIGYITQKAKAAGYKRPGEDGVAHDGVTPNPDDYYYRRNGDGFELARMPGRDVPQFEAVVDSTGQFTGIRPAEERAKQTKLLDLPYDRAKQLLFAPDASMDPYSQMLDHLQIATRADVDATAKRLYEKQTMKEPSTIDSWRSEIKKHYRKRVDERLYDPSLSDAESYRQLRDAVDLLANKDRANVVEGWYKARRLQGADVKAQVEYAVTRTSGVDQGKTETRQADFVVSSDKIKGKEIVEIKDIDGRLDKEQFGAYVDALRDTKARAKLGAERMRYVFTKTAGAKESLDFLAKAYDRYELTDRLVIEVYMPDGSRETASNATEALRILKTVKDQ